MTKENQQASVRERLQALIKKNHKILTSGCGSKYCTDHTCASSGETPSLEPNSAVNEAVKRSNDAASADITCLSSHEIHAMITQDDKPLLSLLLPAIKQVFSDPVLLSKSFLQKDNVLEDTVNLQREQVEEVYITLFKLNNSEVEEALCDSMSVLSKSFTEKQGTIASEPSAKYLLNCVVVTLLNPLIQSPEYAQGSFAEFCGCVASLDIHIKVNLVHYMSTLTPDILTTLLHNFQQVIAFSIAMITDDVKLEDVPTTCNGCSCLQLIYAAVIYRSQHTIPKLLGDLSLSAQASVDEKTVKDVAGVTGRATRMLDGDSPPIESARLFFEEESTSTSPSSPENSIERIFSSLLRGRKVASPQKLLKLVGIDPLWDCHTDVDLTLFYNENISEEIKIEDDYVNYKTGRGFSFLNYPFILLPNIKSVGLLFDNKINMNRQINPLQLLLSHPRSRMPFLKITVRRTHLIEDALLQLEMVTEESPMHLQKQLFVEFDGEEGVDEGGVQNEFFQLVIAELFKPDYGMYVEIEDTKTLWFNPQSFEAYSQYKLIGMILGLAVYNSVILDIRFPQVLYQKLMGGTPDIRDLVLSHPMLGSSLQQLLDYPGEDVEDVFMLDYAVSTTGVFGETVTVNLIDGGADIAVTNDNRADFVARHVDYVLNKSVELQFDQFKKGFDMVTETSQLKDWFRPEELEKLIVGTQILDFKALEKATHYDGGFDENTTVIKWFWEVIHSMSEEDQSKFLSFATGCNRAPIGGMGEMSFTIAKNGADSERLPCSHTCFNVVLVPEYATKEKLEKKLYKAIQYFEGFGMI